MKIPCSLSLNDGEYLELVKKDGSWFLSSNEATQPVPATVNLSGLGMEKYRCIYHASEASALVIRFSDLHRHSDYSLMDGQSKVADIVKKTEYSGALTDHGNMHGMLDYYKTMTAAGKKAIIGFEAYQEDLDHNPVAAHVVLLAKNQTGYHNLLYLTSEAYEHFYNKPQVTWEMLETHHEGLIASSACMGGLAQIYLQNNDTKKAEETLKRYQSIFGEDFYVELQRHNFREEEIVMGQMRQLAEKLGIKVIATVDSHYTNKEDKEAHECLLCLQTKKTLQEPHWSFSGDGYYIHTSEEMEELFGDIPEALDNTLEIEAKCNVKVPTGELNMPIYPIPSPYSTPEEYFEHLCREGWKQRFNGKPQMTDIEYIKRFDYELSMIKQMGFVSYFLIVWDYINWAREHDIYVGPGRGSAAGSLVAYCIGMTDLDPIKYNLLFERFLNPERVSMPDVDTDFEHTRRQEVIDYVSMKYGAENVCRIITFGTLAAKQSVKDMARVLGYPAGKGLDISKMIPNEPHMTLTKAMSVNPDLKAAYDTDPDTKTIIDMAQRLEGCNRNASVHACFDKDTKILTKDGYKNIIDVQKGDFVLTHMNRFQPVVDTIETETDMVYTIKSQCAIPIKVTGNHPLFVRKGYSLNTRSTNGNSSKIKCAAPVEWIPADEVKAGDYLGIVVNNYSEYPKLDFDLPFRNPDFWWIIGRYLGDGWTEEYHRTLKSGTVHTEQRVIICCGKKKPDDLADISARLNALGFRYRVEEVRTTYKIHIRVNGLFDYLQMFKKYAHNKELPEHVVNLPVNMCKALLQGYLSADGFFLIKEHLHSVKTTSLKLAMGIQQIITKVYHRPVAISILPAKIEEIEGRTVHSREKYTLKFHEDTRTKDRSFYENGFIWNRVSKVEQHEESRKMYNLTVLNDSSYTANGIVAHNCGVVLSPKPVREYLPVLKETDEESGLKVMTSQVQGPEVEELSLLKMDFLGLKNMTVIHDVLKNIQNTRNLTVDYHDIPLDDRDTYRMLRDGNTGGVFQLESPGMTNVVTQMLADVDNLPDEEMHQCFERMIAVVALYRPGPMDFIEDYIAGMRDPSVIHYDHPMTQDILRPTYGVIVFQEQVMQLVQRLAGYSLGRADLVRKAMGKKKQAIMDAERQVFIYGNDAAYKSGKDKAYVPGCINNGIPEETAIVIWDKMAKFAQYAFNRSHAACYAYIAIITAYMRCHWMPEFYAAMCNAFRENSEKLCNYLVQASQSRIPILPPDINRSEDGFVSDNGKDIRFGLSGLKGVKNLAPKIVSERKANGEFTGPFNLFHRMNMCEARLNKTVLDSLTWSGALDSFGYTKTGLTDSWKTVGKASDTVKSNSMTGQYSFFGDEVGEVEIQELKEVSEDVLMEKEKEIVGFYLTKHPIDTLMPYLDPADRICTVSNLPTSSSSNLKIVGIISNVKTVFTKKDGRRMFLFELSDRFSGIRCVVFPNDAEANASNIYDGKVVVVEAAFRNDDGEERQLIIKNVIGKDQIRSKATKIIVSVRNKYEQEKLLDYVKQHSGNAIVVIENEGKEYPTKRKVNLTAGSIDWLKQNFTKVLCG